ncbi:DUF5050 domain-containing protein [Paenibacillus sp. TRM 82003]|nr:DUF5050 domain-containing protein [Paenibacillus sp. TRM 82003]
MKRKSIALAVAGCLLCGSVQPWIGQAGADAASNTYIQVRIDGETQAYTQPPVNANGSVMVPMRAIFETLGAQLEWIGSTSTVKARKGDAAIELVIGSSYAIINGANVKLNAAPINVNGNTMVPIRFISEALGGSVSWDNASRTVVIESGASVEGSGESSDEGSVEGFVGAAPAVPANAAAAVDPRNGNANSEGVVASDDEWIYYTDGAQLLKVKKDRSERATLAKDVVPRFITPAGEWLYFANFEMNSSPLYKIRKDGTGLAKVTQQSAWFLGKSGDWLVFYQADESSGGLYRLNIRGGQPERIVDDQVGYVNADDQWVYYNNISEGNTLYKVKVDGSERAPLDDTHVGAVQSVGETIYYMSIYDLTLRKIRRDGTGQEAVASNVGPFNVQGDWIYYLDIYDNRSLYKMRTDGTGRVKLTGDAADNILLAGNWIFYQNGDDGSRMYTMSLDGGSKQLTDSFAAPGEGGGIKVVLEDFAQERTDAAKRVAVAEAERKIVEARAGKSAEQVADEIVDRLIEPGMSDFEKLKALHDYVVRNVTYDFTNYMNGTVPKESHTAYGALVNGIAVCEGYSLSLEMLLNKAGIENIHVYGTANSYKGGEGHTWNMVKLDGRYYHIDATWDDPANDSSPYVSYGHFLVDDSLMEKAHQWDRSSYPQASDDRYVAMDAALMYGAQLGDWYYYTDALHGEQVYKFNVKTLAREKVIGERANVELISGGWLYYSLGSDSNRLYRMKLDGSGESVKLANQQASFLRRIGDSFVYATGFQIYKVHKDGGQPVKLVDDVPQAIAVTDEHIYYNTASYDNGHIYRMNPDGSGRVQIDNESSIRSFGIDGDWIYFSTMDGQNGKMRLDGSQRVYLAE